MRCVSLICALLAVFLGSVQVVAQTVQINELQSSNGRTLGDEDGDFPDWIELWNRGTLPVDLGGYGLSDRFANPFKWVFIPGAVVAPGDFLVVHASGKDRQPMLLPALAPREVPGLRTWLRADAVNSSDPGQVRTTVEGLFLRQWADLSGHKQHAVQSAEHRQPRWIAAGARLRVRRLDRLARGDHE